MCNMRMPSSYQKRVNENNLLKQDVEKMKREIEELWKAINILNKFIKNQ